MTFCEAFPVPRSPFPVPSLPKPTDAAQFAAIPFGRATGAGFAAGLLPGLEGLERFGRGAFLVTSTRFRRTETFLDAGENGDRAVAGTFREGDFQKIARAQIGGGFDRVAGAFHLAGGAGLGGERAGFKKPCGPKPLVGAEGVGHRWL